MDVFLSLPLSDPPVLLIRQPPVDQHVDPTTLVETSGCNFFFFDMYLSFLLVFNYYHSWQQKIYPQKSFFLNLRIQIRDSIRRPVRQRPIRNSPNQLSDA